MSLYTDSYEVGQELKLFSAYRKGTSMILDPAELLVTVADEPHPSDDKGYSKSKYTSYELAEIQTNGSEYILNGSDRPFMWYLKLMLDGNRRHHVKPIVENAMWYNREQKGWYVEWHEMADKLQNFSEKMLAQDVAPMLDALKPSTVKRKKTAGYTKKPLYASGELFKAVRVEVLL